MNDSTIQPLTPSWSELHAMILATSEQMKETDRKMQETYRRIKEMQEMHQETGRYLKETYEKTEQQIKEINKNYGGFTNEFGKMIEDLCKPAALEIFKKEGIGIDHIYEGPRHGRKEEEEIEVDVLLCNKTVAVAVEVKTTCFKKDVDYFLKQMKRFKEIFHEFEGKTIYLAIAAMRFANGSDKYALRNGLYVLSPLSDGMFTLGKPNNRKEF